VERRRGILQPLGQTVQHRRDLRTLEAQYGPLPRSTAAIVAAIVSGWESSRSSSCFSVSDACGGVGQANDCIEQDAPVRPHLAW
jgi:hypothetical protein